MCVFFFVKTNYYAEWDKVKLWSFKYKSIKLNIKVNVINLNWLKSLESNKPGCFVSINDGRVTVCSISCLCIHLEKQMETVQ